MWGPFYCPVMTLAVIVNAAGLAVADTLCNKYAKNKVAWAYEPATLVSVG